MSRFQQVFVIGAPRSGTTFLSGLLADTRFGRPLESHFIPKYRDRLERYGDLNERRHFTALISDILRERPVLQWGLQIDPDRVFDEYEGEKTYAGLVDRLFTLRRDPGAPRAWGDKTPQYSTRLDVIDELFPSARYVYIVRDGRDVALSMLKKSWGPHNVYACAEDWVNMNRRSALHERLEHDGQLFTLRYEELLGSPEEHVAALYRFLGEPIADERIAELVESTKSDNFFKWRSEMTRRQIETFDSVAGGTLAHFGYDVTPNAPPVPWWRIAAYRLHNRALILKELFVLNVVEGFRIRFLGAQPFGD